MNKIVYIAGYGRSGSTILDIILSNHPQIIGVGEVMLLLDDWAEPNRQCACGRPYPDCEFWQGLFPNHLPPRELGQLVRHIEKVSFAPRLLLNWVGQREQQQYRDYHQKLFAHITSQAGKAIIVDSSKSARYGVGRPLALARLAGQEVYILHLVRDGLATMESLLVTGSNWELEGYTSAPKWQGLRAAFGWVSANFWASVVGWLLGPKYYLRLRYEDFLADPTSALQKLSQFLAVDLQPLADQVNHNASFQVGHLVGGNRVRLQGAIQLKRSGNGRSGGRLKRHQRLLFILIGGWLNYQYGYYKG